MNLTRYSTNLVTRPTMVVRRWLMAAANAPESLAWLVFSAVASNLLAYVLLFSNPIIRSDAWYFLDVFVRKALDGTLQLSDFFVRRGGLDHAQPLRKLILLIDLRYFHLDFRWEAVAGWLAAMISLLFLRRIVLWHEQSNQWPTGVRIWIWAAMCVVLVSLNSTGVWTWPLVASGFTSYVFLFALLIGLWRWLTMGRLGGLIASALILDIVANDTALLMTAACLVALGIAAWQDRHMRKRAITGAGVLVACLLIIHVGYIILFTPPSGAAMTTGQRLGHLATDFVNGGWWRWIIVPLSSAIAFSVPLKAFVGGTANTLQILIGVALLAAHVWFWWRVLWRRPSLTAPAFAAIALMLVFYALLAGIIYGRVSIFGNHYLDQPRYVLPYSFNIVALLLMLASCQWHRANVFKGASIAVSVLMALFIAWQIPLSLFAWRTGHYIKHYQQNMAWQIGEMARQPDRQLLHCLPELTVCDYPAAKRRELIQLLKTHQLNIFSPNVQSATGLSPNRR